MTKEVTLRQAGGSVSTTLPNPGSNARSRWPPKPPRAAYAFGLARNHPYRDGNKRIMFLALVTFLGVNGRDFGAAEEDVVATILALADGRLTGTQLARWIREHCVAM